MRVADPRPYTRHFTSPQGRTRSKPLLRFRQKLSSCVGFERNAIHHAPSGGPIVSSRSNAIIEEHLFDWAAISNRSARERQSAIMALRAVIIRSHSGRRYIPGLLYEAALPCGRRIDLRRHLEDQLVSPPRQSFEHDIDLGSSGSAPSTRTSFDRPKITALTFATESPDDDCRSCEKPFPGNVTSHPLHACHGFGFHAIGSDMMAQNYDADAHGCFLVRA